MDASARAARPRPARRQSPPAGGRGGRRILRPCPAGGHGAADPGRGPGDARHVLRTAGAAGLRRLLRGRGETVEDLALPVYVPVTLRQAQHREQARGNLVGQMVVPLPIGEPDPGLLLERIAAETARQKASSHPTWGRCSAPGSPAAHCWRSWTVIPSA
jgi:hypothetical protein